LRERWKCKRERGGEGVRKRKRKKERVWERLRVDRERGGDNPREREIGRECMGERGLEGVEERNKER
jgi:hypothetical protein